MNIEITELKKLIPHTNNYFLFILIVLDIWPFEQISLNKEKLIIKFSKLFITRVGFIC